MLIDEGKAEITPGGGIKILPDDYDTSGNTKIGYPVRRAAYLALKQLGVDVEIPDGADFKELDSFYF